MKVSVLLACLLAVTVAPASWAYPDGPPVDACKSMYPTGHHADAQTSDPPYEMTVSSNTITPGQAVTVTVRMKANANPDYPYYEGLFVQARMANCESDRPIGTFTIPANDDFLKTMNCDPERPMSAVAHKTSSHQTLKSFTWTAPSSAPGRIYFRATVLKNEKTFWTNVFSPYLEDATDTSSVPTSYCQVQSTVGSASSLAAVTSLVVAAFVTSLLL